jgi:hypothetical protein
MPDIIHALALYTSLEQDLLDACTKGLSSKVEDGKNFALSFEIFCSQHDLYIEPDVAIWAMEGSTVLRHPLSASPDLARDFAVQAFTFLKHDPIYTRACKLIMNILPKEDAETYTFAVTPYGAALVAEDWHSVHYRNGERAVAAAIINDKISNHDKLACEVNLTATIRALTAFQDQSLFDVQNLIPEFRLTPTSLS